MIAQDNYQYYDENWTIRIIWEVHRRKLHEQLKPEEIQNIVDACLKIISSKVNLREERLWHEVMLPEISRFLVKNDSLASPTEAQKGYNRYRWIAYAILYYKFLGAYYRPGDETDMDAAPETNADFDEYSGIADLPIEFLALWEKYLPLFQDKPEELIAYIEKLLAQRYSDRGKYDRRPSHTKRKKGEKTRKQDKNSLRFSQFEADDEASDNIEDIMTIIAKMGSGTAAQVAAERFLNPQTSFQIALKLDAYLHKTFPAILNDESYNSPELRRVSIATNAPWGVNLSALFICLGMTTERPLRLELATEPGRYEHNDELRKEIKKLFKHKRQPFVEESGEIEALEELHRALNSLTLYLTVWVFNKPEAWSYLLSLIHGKMPEKDIH